MTPTASLQRGKTPLNECPVYDTKQSGVEALLMLDLWGMRVITSLPFFTGPLWSGVVALERLVYIG